MPVANILGTSAGQLAALVLVGCVTRASVPARPTLPPTGLGIADAAIEQAVQRELRTQPAVAEGAVLVASDDRVVTLTGVVPNLLAKQQAHREAESVRGVRAVVNLVDVEPERRPDALVEADVRDALAADAVTADEEIRVHVVGGLAVLRGVVDAPGERELAELVASSVRGLVGVQNDLELNVTAQRSDADIQEEISARLRWDALVNAGLIRISVRDGRVVLRGTLGSVAEKKKARAPLLGSRRARCLG